MGNGLFLHRGVNNHTFELAFLDSTDIDCSVDGGAEQLLQSGLSQAGSKAPNLGSVTRWAGVKVLETGKVLPVDVLGKALHQLFVAEVKAVLEQRQCDHEPQAQTRSARIAGFAAARVDNGTGQVCRFFALLVWPFFVGKLRRHASLHCLPGQTGCQHHQWMPVVDHLVDPAAKEVVGHQIALQNTSQNSQALNQYFVLSGSSALPHLP